MITRRDKLLNKPWEQRKYDYHLRKIQSAVPVIDNKPPPLREHVSNKLKKRQKEIERIRQIENDNLILLRRINYVMNTNRVDNWNIPPQQAKFINRVPLSYSTSRPSSHSTNKNVEFIDITTTTDTNHNHLRKSKCFACSPHRIPAKPDDSARVPWEEPKMYSKCLKLERSRSLPVIKPIKTDKSENVPKKNQATASAGSHKSKNGLVPLRRNNLNKHKSLEDSAQKLVISRGSLKLCVKFPSDSQIMLKDGCHEKIVFGHHNVCACKM